MKYISIYFNVLYAFSYKKETNDGSPWLCRVISNGIDLKRYVNDRVRYQDHDKDETRHHRSQVDSSRHPEKIPVEVWQYKHHRDNPKQDIHVEPAIGPIHGAGNCKHGVLDDHDQ